MSASELSSIINDKTYNQKMYEKALKLDKLYDETGFKKDDNVFPKTPEEAFGKKFATPAGLASHETTKEFIEKYAIHSDKKELLKYWNDNKY